MGPLVSIVVPVHDVADYLDECVGSILGQTHVDLDVVLVDDGSSDGSEVLCDAWAERDPRVRVIHQAAQGSSTARNVGIDASVGEWLVFADSDDVLSPHLVAILLAAAQVAGAEIALAEYVEFETGEDLSFTAGSFVSTLSAAAATMQVMCHRPQWGPMAKMLRRDLLVDGPRFPEGLLHQDLAFTPRVFGRATLVARTDAIVYGHRQRRGSVTETVQRVALSPDLVTIHRSNIELARRTVPPPDFAQYLAAYLRHAVRQLERIGDTDAWQRNEPYVRAVRGLLRDHLPEASTTGAVNAPTRVAWRLALAAPRPYAVTSGSLRGLWHAVGAGVRGARARA